MGWTYLLPTAALRTDVGIGIPVGYVDSVEIPTVFQGVGLWYGSYHGDFHGMDMGTVINPRESVTVIIFIHHAM